MPRLGQHFLKNRSAAKKIVSALWFNGGGIVIEIGAGHGELTEALLGERGRRKVSGESGMEKKIIAIEKDDGLVKHLRKKFLDEKHVKIIHGDALKILLPLSSSLSSLSSYKLAGNIPYYLTGKLLRLIGELENKPKLCVFTLQKEVALRLCSEPPRMNRLAASVQFWAEPRIIGYLSKKDFKPPPEVDSAIVKLEKSEKRKVKRESYYRAVRALFAQPRKTVVNNLLMTMTITREEIEKKLIKIGIDPGDRPQSLSVENIIRIAGALF